ncbi:hypothetical protein REPUB_Repub12eG0019800 [Reevesia pubescens]
MAKTDMAVASAATLVAAQCVEAAEAMGAEREHLASMISSAVKAAVIPMDKGGGNGSNGSSNGSFSGELVPEDNFLGICSRELLARGCELLKRTRKGDLHWKVVSVYINRINQQRKIQKEELKKAERRNRDEFRKLMEGHVASGILTAKTH